MKESIFLRSNREPGIHDQTAPTTLITWANSVIPAQPIGQSTLCRACFRCWYPSMIPEVMCFAALTIPHFISIKSNYSIWGYVSQVFVVRLDYALYCCNFQNQQIRNHKTKKILLPGHEGYGLEQRECRTQYVYRRGLFPLECSQTSTMHGN